MKKGFKIIKGNDLDDLEAEVNKFLQAYPNLGILDVQLLNPTDVDPYPSIGIFHYERKE